MQEEVAILPLDQILDPKYLLRFVKKRSVEYLEMLDSIDKTGLWNSICVRPAGDRAPGKYEAIDGFYRLTCCRDLGRATIPCIIRYGVTDDEVLAAQIRAQAVRPETTTIEFAKHLRRIQEFRPGITIREIAGLVNKKPAWVGKQLNLLDLEPAIQRMVDRGDIPIMSAYMLAKIPPRLRPQYVDPARAMSGPEFRAVAAAVIKRFMEQVRQGKLDEQFNDRPFQPQPYLRSFKEVLREFQSPNHAAEALAIAKAETPMDGLKAALEWVLNLDPKSVEQKRKAAEQQQRVDLNKFLEERQADDEDALG